MRRSLLTLAAAAVFGLFFSASDASACCHKRKACPTPVACAAPAPAPVACAPAPVECAPAKKKCFGGGGGFKLGCHKKKAACAAPAMACDNGYGGQANYGYAAPASYGYAPAAAYPSGQSVYATGQGY